jgi:PAS domain S-box-containing protein
MIASRVFVVGPDAVASPYRAVLAAAGAAVETFSYADAPGAAGAVPPDAVVLVASDDDAALVERCRAIRAEDALRGTRLIVVVPPGLAELHSSLLDAGADVCVYPGVSPHVLVAQVRSLVVARRRSNAALFESEERLRLAIETTELGTFDWDTQVDRLVWSPMAKRHFGLGPDAEVTFDIFLRGLHPEDRERMERTVADALRPDGNGEYATEYRTIGIDDGQERWLSARGRVFFDASRRPVRFIGATVDITARKRADEALRLACDDLQEADRRKDEFIAILSHELRNPLAPIHFALPLIAHQPLTPSATRSLRVVERQVGQLTRLVDDLLDVSRISVGKLELRPERVTLGSIVESALDSVSTVLEASRHTIVRSLPDQPIWILADVTRLTQVMTNIVNNAAKCTPRGGRISVHAGVDHGIAFVRVRDNGIGIPARDLTRVFEMFTQVNRSNPPQGGLGIGLALSRRILEMHGGSIEAHSAGEGCGAEFVVRIPAVAESRARESASPVETVAPQRRLRVLIVDDNEDLVEMLTTCVADLGHDVRRALDGESGLAAALSYVPDIVLLDLGLPVRSGIDVARELRRRPHLSAVRLVAITGWGQPADRARTQEAGFDEHLTKPIDPAALVALLGDLSRTVVPRHPE